jgi:hypothetical protein
LKATAGVKLPSIRDEQKIKAARSSSEMKRKPATTGPSRPTSKVHFDEPGPISADYDKPKYKVTPRAKTRFETPPRIEEEDDEYLFYESKQGKQSFTSE